jgi:hypothetical protein
VFSATDSTAARHSSGASVAADQGGRQPPGGVQVAGADLAGERAGRLPERPAAERRPGHRGGEGGAGGRVGAQAPVGQGGDAGRPGDQHPRVAGAGQPGRPPAARLQRPGERAEAGDRVPACRVADRQVGH